MEAINNNVIIERGRSGTGTSGAVTYPLAYPKAVRTIQMKSISSNKGWSCAEIVLSSITLASFKWARTDSCRHYYLLIGY